jgi:DNA helicase-2/ATP-dependent DNA helicase PcrA
MALLDDLNPQQREAVLATEGPVLVLAGAGSGKTRVITYRVAYLIERGVPGEFILAVTFTNKAADQMKERVARLLRASGRATREPWISTFHSFCARLLRREATRLGLRHDFAIYDQDDQTAAVKLALKQLGLEDRGYQPRGLLERISFAKNHGFVPEQVSELTRDEVLGEVFRMYAEMLQKAAALDFDDLLLRAVEVLQGFADARETWHRRFRYLQVDEYQDTNRIQYELVRLLADERQNLCVVGDEDQSIYGWRGADVGNILRFAEDFPRAQVFRLEDNYRSTQKILDAAGAVVARNVRRLGKTLRATRGTGRNLRYFEAQDAGAEAEYVTGEIYRLQRENPEARIAVLYRTNFQSRAFEESLRRLSVRYRVLGGFSFYQRAEVKDVLCYLRLILNPDDNVALVRVLNTPPRGIGQKTLENVRRLAQQRGISLWAAIGEILDPGGEGRGKVPLRDFRKLIEGLRAARELLPPAELLRAVLKRTGYLEVLEQQDNIEDRARADNLRELVNALAEAEERDEALEDFLDRAALVSDADDYDERESISLMTLHSAKGLEFDHVFIAGMEEGLFPHNRSMTREEDLEEERRLCYVGMTRAKDTLTLTRAVYRRIYGNDLMESSLPSRFLREIPGELIETAPGSLADAGEARRYEPDAEYAAEEYSARGRRGLRRAARPRATASNPLIGMRVRHPRYGLGTIIAVEGEDEERKLTVSFSDYGTKKLLERYANLERA